MTMPNPIPVDCPSNIWTKVATSVKNGIIWITKSSPHIYLQTWKVTGDPAPTLRSEGVKVLHACIPIQSTINIDVYIHPIGKDGCVRVDL